MNKKRVITYGLASVSIMASGMVGITSFADGTDVVDEINITVPVSCTLEGTGMNSHNAEILNGQYNSSIGETTLKAYCNDNEGFAIYAIGYTDNLNGKNVLTSSVLGSTHDIVTGTSTTGANSNWAMKLSTVSSPVPTYPIIIAGSSDDTERESGDPDFTSFQQIPNDYTLVAKRTGSTDIGTNAEGSTLKTTYQAYISKTQPAGTYTGQVKYTLIHPHDEPTPPSSMLQDGRTVNAKMKNISAGINNATFGTANNLIKSIQMANSLPANFEATETNTVSTPDSKYPIYIFFDNTNNAGIMYFYTENDTVVMNPDSQQMFRLLVSLVDVDGVIDWDTSNVTNLAALFWQDNSLTDIDALSDWDTSNVTTLQYTFARCSSLIDISSIANWDTKNVKNMINTFSQDTSLVSVDLSGWSTGSLEKMDNIFASDTSLVSINLSGWDTRNTTNMRGLFALDTSLSSIDLSGWDTRKVTDMSGMFYQNTSLLDVSTVEGWNTSSVATMEDMFAQAKSLTTIDVSGWDTSSVTSMNGMFAVGESYAGDGQLTEIIGLSDLDVSNVTDMTCMFYGAGKMTHYDIANWDVSKVESFNHMFADNFKLESLDLSKWDVSSVKTMYNMFDDARALTTIGDVSHWNTVNLIDVGGWLNGATSFVGDNGTLDLSGWNTSNLKSTNEMLRATKLETVDMTGWTFDSITNQAWEGAGEDDGIYYTYSTGMATMFKDITQLNAVYVSQLGLDSFNAAVNRGVSTTDMWSGSAISTFTVK